MRRTIQLCAPLLAVLLLYNINLINNSSRNLIRKFKNCEDTNLPFQQRQFLEIRHRDQVHTYSERDTVIRTDEFASEDIAETNYSTAYFKYLVLNKTLVTTKSTQDIFNISEDQVADDMDKSIYFRIGHSHLVSKNLRDERLAPLTRWTQTYIYNHQHPADCSVRRFLISDGWPSGIGSEIHVIGSHLAYALEKNLTLLLSPRTCVRFVNQTVCGLGCACYFRPITPCGNISTTDPRIRRIYGLGFARLVPRVFKAKLRAAIPGIKQREVLRAPQSRFEQCLASDRAARRSSTGGAARARPT